MENLKSICRALCVLWAMGMFMPVAAQNNPYKIDDSLYLIYQRATKYRTLPQGLLIADTLYMEAVKKEDKKAQCLALTIPVIYAYGNHTGYEALEQTTHRLKEVSRKNGYLQYYYFACSYEMNYLLLDGRSLAALQKAEEVRQQAFEEEYAYGIFSCIRMIGNIYLNRGDWEQAIRHYKSALDYMLTYLPEQDPSSLYRKVARYYIETGKDETEALEYIEKAITGSKTQETLVSSMLYKCLALWQLKRIEEFRSYYEVCMRMIERVGIMQKRALEHLYVYKLMLDGKNEEAYRQINLMEVRSDRLQTLELFYVRTGNYKSAYDILRQRKAYKDSLEYQIQSDDLAELNVQVGNERMKLKAKALELENAELNAKNANMKLKQTESQMALEKANAEKDRLALNNKELELSRLKMDSERQKVVLKEQQVSSHFHIAILGFIISFMSLFTGFLIFYVYKRRKSMVDLRRKNEELSVARGQAEQADRMKTFFIQNMSHEIRTPLNAIVGFSQLLFDSDMSLDEEEKKEFSMLIQQNSELLTTLINDILDLSNLESGKYTMNIESHGCNDLCRTAIATVAHRKSQSVKLYYTSEVDDDYRIMTDVNRCSQVLINFLTNAEKYTEEGEIHLHCSLSEYPGKITFSVTDTGTGIPDDKAEVVFERFKKLDEFKQGTGLGLNICRIIAERLHGEVKLDRNYTSGARFLFILPV